jgi:predicted nucleic acid-binding protein
MREKKNSVVVDASLAVKWATYEDDTPAAQMLLDHWIQENVTILAPDLLLYETTNIFYKRMRKDQLMLEEAASAFGLLMQTGLNIETITNEKLSLQALKIAQSHKLPATYDAHYLALAEREQCEFWTADERLYNSVKSQFSWVRLLSDHPYTATST